MTGASCIIQNKKGKFLLQHRSNIKKIQHPDKWGLFGGKIEKNETPKQAIIRELKEELNLKINENEIKELKILSFFIKDQHIFYYKFCGKISNLKLMEGQDMKFFSRKEIISNKRTVKNLKTLFLLPMLI